MEDLGCPRRRRPARMIAWVLIASALSGLAEPAKINALWQVSFPASEKGRPGASTAVPLNGDSILVSVLPSGAEASRPAVRLGNRGVPSQLVGADPVSRLAFLRINGSPQPQPTQWASDTSSRIGVPLHAQTAKGTVKCSATGWVKQVGGKVLPLALLSVSFEPHVPPTGTPLLDSSNRVTALFFEASGKGNTGYAIPAEAVHRVKHDVCNGGKLVRGWLGLSLLSQKQSPKVVRILPNSPAAKAGIRPADVLLSIGSRRITDYADAANAFFYLVPGQPVRLKLRRGTQAREFTLTPTRPAAN